jgi:DnaJ-domain-containing protein 1
MPIAQLVFAPIGVTEHADALLEVAFLMGAVDGHLAEEEIADLRETAFEVAVGLSHVDNEATSEENDLVALLATALELTDRASSLSEEARQAAGAV